MIKIIKKSITLSLFFTTLLSINSVNAETIAVFGASGRIGEVIVKEALSRGHDVIGVSRSPEKFTYTESNFSAAQGNPTDQDSVKELASKADAIINTVGGRSATDPQETSMFISAKAITAALTGQGDDQPHLVVIGGGNTMHGSRENMLKNLPGFAKEGTPMFALFMGHWAAYEVYRDSDIDFTFLAPPLDIKGLRDGESVRTANYRTSSDTFVKDAEGNNAISLADLAVAAVDFAEKGLFNKQKVNVAY